MFFSVINTLFYKNKLYKNTETSGYPRIKNNLKTMTRPDARTQKTSKVRNRLKLDTRMSNE